MDATKRPLYIPPQMGLYAEKHRLFEMMQDLLGNLLIHQPENPLDFLIRQLKFSNCDAPRIFLLGPPASGKTTIAMWLSKQLVLPRISRESLLANEWSALSSEVRNYLERKQNVPDGLWAQLIGERLKLDDCLCNGWILEGIPDSRDFARSLQVHGIIPRHVVVLYAPDIVLIERNLGKRVDEITGEVYHTTFDWPTDDNIRWRLKAPKGISEKETAQRLLEYHRNFPGIVQSFGKSLKLINADQPCADAFWQVLSHVRQPPHTDSPFSARILLCGPPGSGKSLQAALLAQKYGLINVCCEEMLKEAATGDTKLGKFIKPYLDGGWPVPDKVVIKLLSRRINRVDCYIRGWVLHGFPKDENQAKRMPGAGIYPNRVFFLNVPAETILERLSYSMVDPVSGERYHTLYKPAITKEINDRLLINPKEMEQTIRSKVDLYFRLSSSLEEYFEDAIFINGDQDPQTIFEYIESYMINPLPVKEIWDL
ncbi:adenylate kinase 8 [Pseudonaja textilis]|uniref:adenylate kinase 8 n=1 Tax=Pseudonaja textilis TaxID=8673 RepID=UPI000EAA5869|nr:adenylate kinase 8 [Pseudonaja textilis]